LVHPCPAHPAVEQVGGDERAAFEAAFAAMGRPVCRADYDQDAYGTPFDDGGWTGWQARAALAQPSPALPPFAEKVLAKLRRFYDCASDFESGGVDIGRRWLDLLTQLGLLNRIQRSPALWEISQQGEDLLEAPVAQAQQLNDLDKQCRDDVARALGLRPNQERGFAWSYLLASIKSCVKASGDSAQAQHSVPGKYDDVLLPFLKSMEHELHANAGKGDRPGWLQMDRKTALLEIYYHLGKLQKATKGNDTAGIVEYAADVANMSMMLVDVCGLLADAPGKEGV
ncbi:TPA: hypothetical protein ACQSPE_006211, partial [Pseudomonas aeruginosa]